jgi:hypothetical protein
MRKFQGSWREILELLRSTKSIHFFSTAYGKAAAIVNAQSREDWHLTS